MKPTVIANANSAATSATNGMNIPINHEYVPQSPYQQQQQHQQQHHQQHPQQPPQPQHQPYPATHTQYADATAFGSPNTRTRMHQQQPQQPTQLPQQQPIPAQFQGFGLEPDMDMDMNMFPRTRLGARMHDPFAGFGTTRKRSGLHEPQHTLPSDGFSRYFDNDTDFDFPQFASLGGRRRAPLSGIADDDDFFNRLPSEFRQYIPESFAQRRAGTGAMPSQQQSQQPQHPQQQQQQPQPQPQYHHTQAASAAPGQYYQAYVPAAGNVPPPAYNAPPQSPSKKLCDAAIQTEAEPGRSEVDHAAAQPTDNLNQHGLRNTVDMGVKSAFENEFPGARAHSAPPTEQQQQQQQQKQHSVPINGKRPTPPPQDGRPQFGTQTSATGGPAPFQKVYYAPQQQSHPQQKQQSPPPPQTPGGSYIRTIPIFVEGRSEPIINSHKEIPNQYGAAGTGAAASTATSSARAYSPQREQQQQQYYQPQQQQQQQQQATQQHPTPQHRPTPLNTQQPQQPTEQTGSLPPQTPHTLDSINKIQDIQRDVLELMGKVENFAGRRQDKEYAYLDEMLTRNLLKLDTIDTNGKESIRLARKEAIKCIQASINVLEAKAEENTRRQQAAEKSASTEAVTKETVLTDETEALPVDATKIQEAIPLPPPEGLQEQQAQKDPSEGRETSPTVQKSSSGAITTELK